MAAPDTNNPGATVLLNLLKSEIGFSILGLRLFIACVVIASAMLGLIWLVSAGLTGAMGDNARRILGGDVAVRWSTRRLKRPRSPL